ncbi:hypothetical protein CkaCkLH20_01307 [Colletotrichum karsti]|uniref:Transcription factor domain-containing protein n=1 Tax=Colletotrichum karsti TaxID=1095194 RepID=A0A9P6ID08_9PEZI|nr:uncharacterized protein CkaCkLH20_01307 [Colletotrichum karsti]KAF9881157.1 hypothetical protein CkaCkLH20_01307 [Colletotrichum karsti]
MLNLLEMANNSGNLAPSSFTDFQGCSIATIILILTGICERDPSYETQVAFGLTCLRKMANMHTAGRIAVSFVEALVSIAAEARARLRNDRGAPEHGEEDSDAASYAIWADWFSGVAGPPGSDQPTDTVAVPNEPRATRTAANTMPMWEEASALLRLRNPSTPDESYAQSPSNFNMGETSFEADLNDDFNENRMQLMGLTGIDMLDFGFGPE